MSMFMIRKNYCLVGNSLFFFLPSICQEKIRVALYVQQAALHFIDGTAKLRFIFSTHGAPCY